MADYDGSRALSDNELEDAASSHAREHADHVSGGHFCAAGGFIAGARWATSRALAKEAQRQLAAYREADDAVSGLESRSPKAVVVESLGPNPQNSAKEN